MVNQDVRDCMPNVAQAQLNVGLEVGQRSTTSGRKMAKCRLNQNYVTTILIINATDFNINIRPQSPLKEADS